MHICLLAFCWCDIVVVFTFAIAMNFCIFPAYYLHNQTDDSERALAQMLPCYYFVALTTTATTKIVVGNEWMCDHFYDALYCINGARSVCYSVSDVWKTYANKWNKIPNGGNSSSSNRCRCHCLLRRNAMHLIFS